MDFDAILEEIGEFGKYQIINYLLLCLPVLFSAGNSLTYVFTAGVPKYRCFIPGCDNENSTYDEPWVAAAIPGEPQTLEKGRYVAMQCEKYEPLNVSLNECTIDHFNQSNVIHCDSWVFDDDEYTIVQEWNLTCLENYWKLSLVGTVHFCGILAGTVFSGFLADRYGRKIIFILCIVFMSVTGIAQAVSPDYVTFQVMVFINALGTSGVYQLAFILGVELVGRKKREMSGIILNYFYSVGEAAIALISWGTKNWIAIQLIVSVPPSLFILYAWFIPESVRWLIANNKNQQASKIIKKAAKVNKVELSRKLLATMEQKCMSSASAESMGQNQPTILETVIKLLKSRRLCLRSFILFYVWAACAFIFYGLSVNSTSMGGNKYLNFALVCLVEIPGYTFSWWAMNKFGRRMSMVGSMLLSSATCIGTAFVPEEQHEVTIMLFLMGKLFITSCFGIIYVYTAELYPTIMRSMGIGATSTMARVGAIIAPFAPLLGIYNKSLPFILFSGVALAAGIMVLLLPETLGTKLPDTVEEAENLIRVQDQGNSKINEGYVKPTECD